LEGLDELRGLDELEGLNGLNGLGGLDGLGGLEGLGGIGLACMWLEGVELGILLQLNEIELELEGLGGLEVISERLGLNVLRPVG
jgi:hypothetical protein